MDESNGRRPTLEDVARRAGVSRALASIVLRDAPGASDASRKRVREAMADLGYRPDRRASRLAASRTRLIGIQFTLESEFHGRLLRCLYDEAAGVGYELLLSGVTDRRRHGEALATLQEARPDGLILIDPGDLPAIEAVEPVVVIGHSGQAGADRVLTSSASGVRFALDHLLDLGHERIVHVAVPQHPVGRARLEAFRQHLRERGLPDHVIEAESDLVGGGTEAAGQLLRDELPTAVLAYNDEVAVGLLVELMRRGIRVPEDVSVVGFDDVGWLATGLQLTTVSQHMEQLAAEAVKLVVKRMEKAGDAEPPRRIVLEPSLRIRRSTAPPRAAVDR